MVLPSSPRVASSKPTRQPVAGCSERQVVEVSSGHDSSLPGCLPELSRVETRLEPGLEAASALHNRLDYAPSAPDSQVLTEYSCYSLRLLRRLLHPTIRSDHSEKRGLCRFVAPLGEKDSVPLDNRNKRLERD